MGRSKPRTNKRPPPKPARSGNASINPNNGNTSNPTLTAPPPNSTTNTTTTTTTTASHPNGGTYTTTVHARTPINHATTQQLPYIDPATLAPLLPPTSLDPSDPAFQQAFQNWSASALSQLGQLPKLTPAQLSALAGAAAGVGDAGLFNPSNPIDLPASLAALFEAKLTLDREKAKLMRMQKELKGYREGVAAANGGGGGGNGGVNGVENGSGVVSSGKGKQVATDLDDDLGECTCGRNGHSHSYPASAHSGSDDYYYYESDECCSCTGSECSHEHECEHTCEHWDHEHDHEHTCDLGWDHDHDHDHDDDAHNHEHGHDHEHDHEHICGHDHDHDHRHRHHSHHYHHHDHEYEDEHGLEEEEELRGGHGHGHGPVGHSSHGGFVEHVRTGAYGTDLNRNGRPSKRITEDPHRLDEAVRELFNWIKAVVWTIEQAATVSGRKSWSTTGNPPMSTSITTTGVPVPPAARPTAATRSGVM